MKRRAARTDSNQEQMVNELRKCGLSVAITSQLGNGFPDLAVAKNKKTVLVEVKDPKKPPSQRKLTPDEVAFHQKWQGKIIVAQTTEDVLNEFL